MKSGENRSSSKAPVRSPSQRMLSLQKANVIRSQRAELKRALKAGEASVVDALPSPPAFLLTAKVLDLLVVVPKFGPVRAAKVLNSCRISSAKTVGGLSDRQRSELIAALSPGD